MDVADSKLLGKYEQKGSEILLSVDHHGLNREFAKYTFVDASAAANCENILKLLKAMNVEIDSISPLVFIREFHRYRLL